jgi:hypothetical protein
VKVKVLIGVLVALIVLNLATIGSFMYWRWRSPRSEVTVWPVHSPEGRRGLGARAERRRENPAFRPSREERQQLMALLEEFRSETGELRKKIYEDENRVLSLMQSDNVRRDEVDSLLVEISRSRLEMGRLAVGKLIESKAYLSPQQQHRFFDSIILSRPGAGMGRGLHNQTHRDHRRGDRREDDRR